MRKVRRTNTSSPSSGVGCGRTAESLLAKDNRYAEKLLKGVHREPAKRLRPCRSHRECAGSNRVRERDWDVLSRITRGRRTYAVLMVSFLLDRKFPGLFRHLACLYRHPKRGRSQEKGHSYQSYTYFIGRYH